MMYLAIALFIASIFLVDGVQRLRRQNAWKRRAKDSQ